MNVSEKIAEWLDEKGFEDCFGIIGSGNMAIWDAIARRGKTKMHCFHHEQAALQAAVFYHRIEGKHAACLVTTGAGSSNAVTGVLCAWMDSIPLFVIAGNEPTRFLESPVRVKGAQGYDFVETLTGITKGTSRAGALYGVIVADPLEALENGFVRMNTPRKGPVVVEIPVDVQNMVI